MIRRRRDEEEVKKMSPLPFNPIQYSSVTHSSLNRRRRRGMGVALTPFLLSVPSISSSNHSSNSRHHVRTITIKCVKVVDADIEPTANIMCQPCNGRGWLLCDYCQGQKTNVKAQNNRIYRRCPSCKAVGSILCSKCKVFKCVTFPDFDDSPIN